MCFAFFFFFKLSINPWIYHASRRKSNWHCTLEIEAGQNNFYLKTMRRMGWVWRRGHHCTGSEQNMTYSNLLCPQSSTISVFSVFEQKSFFVCVFRAAPVAYRSSQARGSIRSCSCRTMQQPQQCQIGAASAVYNAAHGNTESFNPLGEARERTLIFMDTRFLTHWTTMGNPLNRILNGKKGPLVTMDKYNNS